MLTKTFRRTVFAALSLAIAPIAFADAPGDDMLKPDEIKTVGVSSNPANDSGMFLGGGLAFGQGRSTEGDSTPGLAYFLKFEPGYQMSRGTWGRMEIGAELLSGTAAFRTPDDGGLGKVTTSVPFGLLLKFGYGYSIGEKMFGLARVGFGPVMGKVEADIDGETYSSDSLSGMAGQIGWLMVIPMNDALDATGGFSWTHMQFDVDEISNVEIDRTIIVNVPAVEVGLRVRL